MKMCVELEEMREEVDMDLLKRAIDQRPVDDGWTLPRRCFARQHHLVQLVHLASPDFPVTEE